MERAVRWELEELDALGTVLGEKALLLARAMDGPGEVATAIAALSQELSRTVQQAMSAPPTARTRRRAADKLDEVRARRQAKRRMATERRGDR